MQLVALHSYAELKLVFLLKKEKTVMWEHMKTLPHIWDAQRQVRFWADDYEDMKDLSRYLETELNNRRKYEDKYVYIKLHGACASCDAIDFTIKDVIYNAIKEEVEECQGVINTEL